MALKDDNRDYDGFAALLNGVDNGKAASLIGAGYASDAVNATFRGGEVETRPPYRDITLSFENDTTGEMETTFRNEIFQGAEFFRTTVYEQIVCSIGGRHFSITVNPNNFTGLVREFTVGGRNSRLIDRAFLCQANKYLIIQDQNSLPVFYDGSNARRANGRDEVPVGGPMAYGQGRLVVANGRQFAVGDIAGSEVDAELKFTETNFLNEGGAFSLAAEMGIVRFLKFLPQQDTATGQGELLVGGDNGIASVFLSVPREQWKDTQIQRVTLLEVGGTGDKNVVAINGDVWFRSRDGWRSYRQARAEINGWARTPLSTEMGKYFEKDTDELLKYGSGVYFDNRLVSTICPQRGNYRTVHLGLAALDFDPISTFGQAGSPAWEGVWNGAHPLQLVTGVVQSRKRCFVFEWLEGTGNQLKELTQLEPDIDEQAPISRIITKSLSCNHPYNLRELVGGDIWVKGIVGNYIGRALYSTEQDGCYYCWDDFSEAATSPTDCSPTGCSPNVRCLESRPRLAFGRPPPGNRLGTSVSKGYEHQMLIEWSGRGKMTKGRFHFENVDENVSKLVDLENPTAENISTAGLDENWSGSALPDCPTETCPCPFSGGIVDPEASVLPVTPPIPGQTADPVVSAASIPGTANNDATVTCDTVGATIFYRLNGGAWTTLGFSGSHLIMSNLQYSIYEFYAHKGGNHDSAIVTYDNTASFASTVATPVVTPALSAGDYHNNLTVTCATGGAQIYYRLNGGGLTLLGPSGTVLTDPANDIPSVYTFVGRLLNFNDSAIATYDNSALGKCDTPGVSKATAHGVVGNATITAALPAGLHLWEQFTGAGGSPFVPYHDIGTSPQTHSLGNGVYSWVAKKSQWLDSDVATYDNNVMGTTATPVFSHPAGAGTAGSATITCATPSSNIFYRYNGGSWIAYTGAFTMANTNPSLYESYATAAGFIDSGIASYDNTAALKVATPNIGHGAPGHSQTVTISCSTPGAAIFKDVNGGGFTPYTGAFNLGTGRILTTYATKAGYIDSDQAQFENVDPNL